MTAVPMKVEAMAIKARVAGGGMDIEIMNMEIVNMEIVNMEIMDMEIVNIGNPKIENVLMWADRIRTGTHTSRTAFMVCCVDAGIVSIMAEAGAGSMGTVMEQLRTEYLLFYRSRL